MTKYYRDAFRVATITADDRLYTGRWEINNAWSTRGLVSGPYPKRPKSILLHSRMATHGYGLINAHPHVSPNKKVALIHNGVVSTQGLDLRRSECDSEGILNAYTDAGVDYDPREMQTALNRVHGYYALGIYSRTNDVGSWAVDIVRDSIAPLHYMFVDQIKLGVFLTDPEHLREAASRIGLRLDGVVSRRIKDNIHLRFDTSTGQRVHTETIKEARVQYFHNYANDDEERYKAWRGHMKTILV